MKTRPLIHIFWIWICLCPAVELEAESWRFTANEIRKIDKGDESRTVLSGNAYVESDTIKISARQLEFSGKDNEYISGSGKIAFINTEREIKVNSERLGYNRISEIVGFRERVILIDEKKNVIVHCESLDFRQKEELIIMQILVRLVKDETVCRGEFVTLWIDEDILEISGHPVVWRNNNVYRADRIRINLETDEIELEGAVEGTLVTTEDEKE